MTAVVVRLDKALGVIGVNVEGVEVGADALNWRKVLLFPELIMCQSLL